MAGYVPGDHFTLRYHPRNQGTMNVAFGHEEKPGHYTTDLMNDLPDGDVCDGMCCMDCDWMREFQFKGKRDIPQYRSQRSRAKVGTGPNSDRHSGAKKSRPKVATAERGE